MDHRFPHFQTNVFKFESANALIFAQFCTGHDADTIVGGDDFVDRFASFRNDRGIKRHTSLLGKLFKLLPGLGARFTQDERLIGELSQ